MSEEGGFEACEEMTRQDVITGLAGFLRKVTKCETDFPL